MTIIHIVLFKISSSLDQLGILKVNKTDRAIPHYERAESYLECHQPQILQRHA